MARILCLFALAFLSACSNGGPVTTPAPVARPPARPGIVAPGRYLVTLLAAAAPTNTLQPDCTPIQFTPFGYVPMPVVRFRGTAVDDEQGGLVLTPDAEFDRGLELRLRPAGSPAVSGTLAGSALDLILSQVVLIDGGEAGIPAPLTGVAGVVSGVTMVAVGDASGRMVFPSTTDASCRLGRWTLQAE